MQREALLQLIVPAEFNEGFVRDEHKLVHLPFTLWQRPPDLLATLLSCVNALGRNIVAISGRFHANAQRRKAS